MCVRAGEPGRGVPPAEAEGRAVRSDPRPEPARRPRRRVAARAQEAAPRPGGPGGRALAGGHGPHRQNPAAAAGPHALRDGDGEDEADPPEGAGGQGGGAGGRAQVFAETGWWTL